MVNVSATGGPQKVVSPYGVKLIRGPFLDLPPNQHHVSEVGEFERLARALRRQGAHLAADLFSGAGGISLGLEEAGYNVVIGADHYDQSHRKQHRGVE